MTKDIVVILHTLAELMINKGPFPVSNYPRNLCRKTETMTNSENLAIGKNNQLQLDK